MIAPSLHCARGKTWTTSDSGTWQTQREQVAALRAPENAYSFVTSSQKCLTRRYEGSGPYRNVERDLAFGIMRSHFYHEYPKGAHCCVQCSLAVHLVLVALSLSPAPFATSIARSSRRD